MNKLIRLIPEEYCSINTIPSLQEIKDYLKLSDDNWLLSRYPFCNSCHNLYKKNCQKIESYFKIKYSGSTNIKEIRKKVSILFSTGNPCDKKYIDKLEIVLQLFIDCISSRLFHHNICFVLNSSHLSSVNTDTIKTNINHTQFLRELCIILKQLYMNYKTALNNYNFDNDNKIIDNIYDKNKNILNICRNIIKNFGCEEDNKNVDDIFKTNTPVKLSCKLSPLKSRKIKQSRPTKDYRISKQVMERLISETHLSRHSPYKGPFVKPPKFPRYKNFKSYLF